MLHVCWAFWIIVLRSWVIEDAGAIQAWTGDRHVIQKAFVHELASRLGERPGEDIILSGLVRISSRAAWRR